ncbi:hypothetical protein [Lonepinella sp. BR2357]|uniref:hypothetical protein n=1 Tax=Lonepinella sp. BR2357 TaxID=3434549 RepID=UPI003F6E1587
MAKKSAFLNGYLIEENEDGKIFVLEQSKKGTVTKCLEDIAAAIGFEHKADWNTRTFGANLVKHAGEKKEADFDVNDEKFRVRILASGTVETFQYKAEGTVRSFLREFALSQIKPLLPADESIPFEDEEEYKSWTTRTLGAYVIKTINALPAAESAVETTAENTAENESESSPSSAKWENYRFELDSAGNFCVFEDDKELVFSDKVKLSEFLFNFLDDNIGGSYENFGVKFNIDDIYDGESDCYIAFDTEKCGSVLIQAINKGNEVWNWWSRLDDSLKFILLRHSPSYSRYALRWNSSTYCIEDDEESQFYARNGSFKFNVRNSFSVGQLYPFTNVSIIRVPSFSDGFDFSFDNIEKLAFLPNLKELYMDDVNIRAVPIDMPELTCLEDLSLSKNDLSDYAFTLNRLYSLKNLKTLNLAETGLTEDQEEVIALKEALPNCQIIF